VATALPELKAKRYGYGTYVAANYDELIDHPVEQGDFALATFKAHGIPHDIVITGKVPHLDLARLSADLKKICETQIAFFEPKTKKAPMDRYVFMTMAVGDGYGGLEHRASTALICARADLPSTKAASKDISDGYLQYLGLCSHEYFHTWNVKRIKPAVFAPYNLQVENYSPLLWLFEGFTSYYDDLMLVRAGLIDEQPISNCWPKPWAAYCAAAAAPSRAWPIPVSTPGASTTARTRMRRTPSSATTPRVRWWRWRWT
jgi:predicted metalloprotease with PDZ domain